MLVFIALLAPTAWNGVPATLRGSVGAPRSGVSRHCAIVAVEVTESYAEQQRAEYFALMPSKELPKVSLDTRLFLSKDNDKVEAGVFARQVGTGKKFSEFRNIGTVATEDEASLTQAVAKQFDLIVRWAYEKSNDFETNKLQMSLGGSTPIELAWSIKPPKPSFFESLQGMKEEPMVLTEVPPGTKFDPELRCGFLGSLAREYRGGGVSARYDRIVIGKEPETPLRLPSQEKYNKKYEKTDLEGFIP